MVIMSDDWFGVVVRALTVNNSERFFSFWKPLRYAFYVYTAVNAKIVIQSFPRMN
jgi:hypothetical protein